jgi:hypothetical protein
MTEQRNEMHTLIRKDQRQTRSDLPSMPSLLSDGSVDTDSGIYDDIDSVPTEKMSNTMSSLTPFDAGWGIFENEFKHENARGIL